MTNLITILGPTATGKTSLAAHLAPLIGGEVISADSRQVYRGMTIGTGKDLDDYTANGIAIPYHLIDIVEPGYEYSVYEFQHDFVQVYNQIIINEKIPVLCGGTGLYIEAILKGYRLETVPVNPELRNELENFSQEKLVDKLKKTGLLHNSTDLIERKRLIRAIEIHQFNQQHPAQKKIHPKIQSINFGISFPREIIRARITERLQKRLESGMLEEVSLLLKNGLTPEQLTFYGLEYRYLTLYIIGQLSYDEMFGKLNTAIHQFAKRQMTWFRRMEKNGIFIHWIDGENQMSAKLAQILKLLPKY